jgi:hypothetical protein
MRADVRNLDRVRLNHLARHDGSIFTGGAGDHKRIGPPCRRVAASSVRCWPNDHDAVQFGDLNVLPQFSHRRGNVEVRLLTECAFGQKSGPGPSVRSVNSAPPAPVRSGEMSKVVPTATSRCSSSARRRKNRRFSGWPKRTVSRSPGRVVCSGVRVCARNETARTDEKGMLLSGAFTPLPDDRRESDGPYAADSNTIVLRARFRQSSAIAAYRFDNRINAARTSADVSTLAKARSSGTISTKSASVTYDMGLSCRLTWPLLDARPNDPL